MREVYQDMQRKRKEEKSRKKKEKTKQGAEGLSARLMQVRYNFGGEVE
jgi:hypothetical protein